MTGPTSVKESLRLVTSDPLTPQGYLVGESSSQCMRRLANGDLERGITRVGPNALRSGAKH